MRLIIILGIFGVLAAGPTYSQTGRKLMGPPTMGHPTAPNSGTTKTRTNDVTGKDMSSATMMSSDEDPRVPEKRADVERTKAEKTLKTGPYEDDATYFQEEGSDGKQAQEAAEKEAFDLSEKQLKRKRRGY